MLVARYQQPMLRLARSMVSSPAVAEEAVQDTWMGVVRGIDRFEGRSSFKTWLFRILVNRARSAGPRNPSCIDRGRFTPSIPARFDAQGQWADPVDTVDRESTIASTRPSGRRFSGRRSTTCRLVSARSYCCEMSRGSPAPRRATCWESASATSGSFCTGAVPDCARFSKPRWGRAEPMLSLRRKDLVCQQAVELVTDYLEGSLSRRDRRRFEAHLRACPNCSGLPGADQDDHRAGWHRRTGGSDPGSQSRPQRPLSAVAIRVATPSKPRFSISDSHRSSPRTVRPRPTRPQTCRTQRRADHVRLIPPPGLVTLPGRASEMGGPGVDTKFGSGDPQ